MTLIQKVEAGLVVTLLLAAISFAFWLGSLQQRLNDLEPEAIKRAQAEALDKIATAQSRDVLPCKASLGQLPFREAEASFQIPKEILDYKGRATELQVYTWVETGGGNTEGPRTFAVTTERQGKELSLPLRIYAYNQPAWSYNSQAMWLPFPDNDHIKARREGAAVTGASASGVEILACR